MTGTNADEPVLELRALRGVGDAREHLEARVHLQRVRTDRDRPLAAVAQAAGERDGDVRLAHRGGSEEGDHACHGGYGAWSVRSHLLRDVPRDRSARGRG